MQKTETIIFCNCGYSDIIDQDVKGKILDRLAHSDKNFEVVQDLCALAAKKDPRLKDWAKADELTIIGCYRRTIKWLFNLADVRLDAEKTKFFNMRTSTAEQIISSLFDEQEACEAKREIQIEKKGSWVPWFPVIDYDRCKNCMQCLNFCLFGVYGLSESEQVQVVNPEGCKTNCPACARVCPEKAIIFAKYPESPINGDEVDDSQVDRDKLKSDSGAVVGNQIYEMLRNRSKTGKRFEKESAGLQDEDLVKIKDQFGIDLDAVKSLKPSDLIEIQKKLEKRQSE